MLLADRWVGGENVDSRCGVLLKGALRVVAQQHDECIEAPGCKDSLSGLVTGPGEPEYSASSEAGCLVLLMN
jgi:hypothetical protein